MLPKELFSTEEMEYETIQEKNPTSAIRHVHQVRHSVELNNQKPPMALLWTSCLDDNSKNMEDCCNKIPVNEQK